MVIQHITAILNQSIDRDTKEIPDLTKAFFATVAEQVSDIDHERAIPIKNTPLSCVIYILEDRVAVFQVRFKRSSVLIGVAPLNPLASNYAWDIVRNHAKNLRLDLPAEPERPLWLVSIPMPKAADSPVNLNEMAADISFYIWNALYEAQHQPT